MQSVAVRPTRSATTLSAPLQEAAAKRISAGDANARFKSVVQPHLDDAYRLARWLTGSHADSEDVVQDACLRALRGIGNFSHGNARAWVLTIVRNTTYSWLHKNRPNAVALVEDFGAIERIHSIAVDAETPETALSAQEVGTLLERRLRRSRQRSGKRSCYARSMSSVTARSPR
jgi:RNA polymerase sigma factor (sigma-70 family)